MQKRYLFGMALILVVAAYLRFWSLPSAPLGLHYDEAANETIVRQIASGESLPIFIPAYTGKEVLFFYWATLWFWLTGGEQWGLRLAGACAGLLTVAATFAATRAMLGNRRYADGVALFAAAWLAVAFPHVLLSHYSFRAISLPLMEMLTIAALWQGWRTGKLAWLIGGGVLLGLTAYTYLAARLFPIPLVLAMAWLIIRTPRTTRQARFRQTFIALVVAALAFAPLGIYFIQNPGTFSTRISQVASPTMAEALHGIWLCLQGLFVPGAGDPYIRFNAPGRAVLDPVFAVLALIGLCSLLLRRTDGAVASAGRVLALLAPAIMLLPSALATSDITPSNLRLVGVFPFVGILVGAGVCELLRLVPPAPLRNWVVLILILTLGGLITQRAYAQWATSSELFFANDGEMVLAAHALDAINLDHTTVYISSLHYRHPTVAALASNYSKAKWLTGGSTLVLPAEGDAIYMVPRTLPSPAAWPESIRQRWQATILNAPDGTPALTIYRLSAGDIAELRPHDPIADFAHVTLVHSAEPLAQCHVMQPCPVLVTWQVHALYPALQPVARLFHPISGQWDRVNPFHYPTADWTPGDVILDQLVVTPPVGTPPVDGYQIGIGFFNPDTKEILPLLKSERFAGLEAAFPLGKLASIDYNRAISTTAIDDDCGELSPQVYRTPSDIRLRASNAPALTHPGQKLDIALCWQAPLSRLKEMTETLSFVGTSSIVLYQGAPVQGSLPFSLWTANELISDHFSVRGPRTMAPGIYTLTLAIDDKTVATLGQTTVSAIGHRFDAPTPTRVVSSAFGDRVRLVGYDVSEATAGKPLTVTLYWKDLLEMNTDYTVFIHLMDPKSGTIIAQVDEQPLQMTYPTSWWSQGEYVRDAHMLSIPANAEGIYNLRVGLYVQENGDRLLPNGQDELDIGTVSFGR